MIASADNRFKHLERKVGIFVIVAVAGLLGAAMLVVFESGLFSPTFNLTLTAPKGTGFSKGMPIKLSGFRIGRVNSITLNDSAAVDVVLQIDKKYRKWLRKDSVAKLVKEGMIGDYIIEIQSGSSAELLAENSAIQLDKTKALDELAEEIAEKVKPVLMDVRDIIAYINSENGDVKKSLRNLSGFTAGLDGTRQKADQLLLASNKNLDGTFRKLDDLMLKSGKRIDQMEPIMSKADRSIGELEQRIPKLMEKIDRTLVNVETVSSEIKTTTSKSLPKVPRLMDNTEHLMNTSGEIMDGVKGIWPLSSVLEPPPTRSFMKGDRHE